VGKVLQCDPYVNHSFELIGYGSATNHTVNYFNKSSKLSINIIN